MKTVILMAVLMTASINICTAQQEQDSQDKRDSDNIDQREELRLGLKAGVNYSNVYNENGQEFVADAKLGFAGGIFMAIPFGKYIGIQPEALYSQKGFKAEGRLLGSAYTIKRTTSYIDIPLQVAFKPSEFITFLAGPQYSFLLKQRDELISSSASYSQEQKFAQDNLRKNMFGFVGGIDVNITSLIISARIGWGLSQNLGDGTSFTPTYKNKWLQGTVGYSF